jgi:hypothetical protein
VEFEDSFEVSEWNSKWVEDSQNDWFRSRQRATNGSWSAEVDGAATDATLTMANAVNLSGKASATLTFSWFIESNWDAGEYIALDVSANGQGWTELKRLRGDVDQENVWHNETVNLGGAYLAAGFKIRFRAKVSDSAEDGNVDNVKIVSYALGSAAGGAAPLRGARSAQGGAAYVRPLNANAFAADLAAAKAGLFAFTAAQSGASSSGGVVSTSGLFNPFRLAPARSAGASVFDPVVSSVPSRPHAADAAIAALMSEGAQTFGEPHAPHDSSNGLDLPIPLRDRLPAKVVGG